MILYLVRHAKSSWAEPGLSDHARPLNDRGRKDAPGMFERLAQSATPPVRIVSSDAVRAASTAELLCEALGLDTQNLSFEPRLYHAGVEEIVAAARTLPNDVPAAALVGHNPGMTIAANTLAENLELDNLPTCGIVGIEFDASAWSDIGIGSLCYFDYPKNADGPLIRNAQSP